MPVVPAFNITDTNPSPAGPSGNSLADAALCPALMFVALAASTMFCGTTAPSRFSGCRGDGKSKFILGRIPAV